MGPLEVEAKHIENLDQVQLVRLLRRLLLLEAGAYNIPRSGVRVPLEINVPDGGEDGRIKWTEGPEQTDFITKKFTVFQCKATKMEPKDCYKEVLIDPRNPKLGIKEKIKEVLTQGGAYIIFCCHSATETMLDGRINEIKRAVKDSKIKLPQNAFIDFYDGNRIANWVNKYVPAQIEVRQYLGLSTPSGLRTYKEWSKCKEFDIPYVTNDILEGYITAIREKCIKDKNAIIRINGLSGLGKTRLVFEAFRHENHDNMEVKELGARVLYTEIPGENEALIDFIRQIKRDDNKYFRLFGIIYG